VREESGERGREEGERRTVALAGGVRRSAEAGKKRGWWYAGPFGLSLNRAWSGAVWAVLAWAGA
jgi:hypothetical protein